MKRIAAVFLLSLCSAGCLSGIPAAAGRAYYNAVNPRWTKSVQNDANLTDEQKATLLQAGVSFDRLLTEAEK